MYFLSEKYFDIIERIVIRSRKKLRRRIKWEVECLMKYRISIFPSKEIQDAANAYRKRYDPNYVLIPPHITLKAPFEIKEYNIEELILELKKIAKEMSPFDISIQKVSTFAPVTNTIYFKVEPREELNWLFQKMHSGKFPEESEYAFVPHITIAQKLSDSEYSDVYAILQMTEVNYEDTVDRFQLLYQLENGVWTVYETFVFGENI